MPIRSKRRARDRPGSDTRAGRLSAADKLFETVRRSLAHRGRSRSSRSAAGSRAGYRRRGTAPRIRSRRVGWCCRRTKGAASPAALTLWSSASSGIGFPSLHAFPPVSNAPSNALCRKFGFTPPRADRFRLLGSDCTAPTGRSGPGRHRRCDAVGLFEPNLRLSRDAIARDGTAGVLLADSPSGPRRTLRRSTSPS